MSLVCLSNFTKAFTRCVRICTVMTSIFMVDEPILKSKSFGIIDKQKF